VEPQLDRPRRRDLGGPLVIGTIVVLVGVYFLLKETFQVDIPDIGRLWPIAVILIGGWFVYEGALRSRP
jgi:amino acid transporter